MELIEEYVTAVLLGDGWHKVETFEVDTDIPPMFAAGLPDGVARRAVFTFSERGALIAGPLDSVLAVRVGS